MSILIKGMKKPQSCAGCYMFLHGLTMDGHPWQECADTERELDDPFGCGRPEWCQIVEIKEPHGRLIDADALEQIIAQFSLNWEYGQGVSDCWDALLAAPTVIEAEGDEE